MFMSAFIVIIALSLYMLASFQVGRMRSKHQVPAPLTDGPEPFLRAFRVQQNTLEQLIVFIPSLLIFAYVISDGIAALLGLIFIAARVVYAFGYYQDAKKRMPGFLIALLVQIVLLVADLIALAMAIIETQLT